MKPIPTNIKRIQEIIKNGTQLSLATQNYPSRGQTAVQELYQTRIGKLFLKRVSERNHEECRISKKDGSLAEREFWAYRLAVSLGLQPPELVMLDSDTTVQRWLDFPDAHLFTTYQGRMTLHADNIFDCALFDWLSGQVDRHDANYLYNFVDQEIILIDSGHAFLKYEGSIPDYLRLFEAAENKAVLSQKKTSSVFEAIKSLSEKSLKAIVPLRNQDEMIALHKRREQIQSVKSLLDIIDFYRRK